MNGQDDEDDGFEENEDPRHHVSHSQFGAQINHNSNLSSTLRKERENTR